MQLNTWSQTLTLGTSQVVTYEFLKDAEVEAARTGGHVETLHWPDKYAYIVVPGPEHRPWLTTEQITEVREEKERKEKKK